MEILGYSQAKEKGVPRYFTGKPCKHGHIAERRVADRGCVVCSSERTAQHRERNPNSSREVAKRYRQKHPERVKASKGRYNAENADAITAYNKKRYAENAEARRAVAKKYREDNLEKIKETQKAYRQKNADRLNANRRIHYIANIEHEREQARRRARETYEDRREYMASYYRDYYASNKDDFSKRSKQWRDQNPDKCRQYHVNRKARFKEAEGSFSSDDIAAMMEDQDGKCKACAGSFDELGYHVDHIEPLSKGGSNWPSNLQLLCPACNLSKGDKDFTEWLESRDAA